MAVREENIQESARDLAEKFKKDREKRNKSHLNSHTQRVEAAKRYAAADKSDPFAFRRAMTHLESGIAGFTVDGRDAFYDAEETKETRVLQKIVNGQSVNEEYTVTAYKNRVRP